MVKNGLDLMFYYNYNGHRMLYLPWFALWFMVLNDSDGMVVWFKTACAISAYAITTKVVRSNLGHGEVYSIQHYAIQFVSELQQVGWHSPDTPVSPTNKTDRNDITEILLNVSLNTINHKANHGKYNILWPL
jgi:hypothetical protein